MKVCLIQPPYSADYSRSDEYASYYLNYMDQCDESMDLIVLPESCDIPCVAHTKEESEASVKKYNAPLLKKAAETAKRCHAMVFVNARMKTENGLRNTTYCFDRSGKIAATYFKEHLVPGEVSVMELDSGYTFEHTEPTVVEMEGIRFGFLVCYDFYFYENFANMARKNLDIIIGCSHQRSDTHDSLEITCRFLAYNTNAYVIRSSITMDETSDICGASMVVAPDGKVLANMKSRAGLETVEIDPTKKYFKPAGYGNPPSAHYEYIEKGRRPWKYRPAGSAIVKPDAIMPYPRVCAHRGFNTVAPENSLPAFGAAIAMGAEEIEFDLWFTKDGEIVSIHDRNLERVSDGEGLVFEHTCEELLQYDFGIKFGKEFAGIKILKFEDILKKFSCHVIMNIHLKTRKDIPYDRVILQKIIDLIEKYDCKKYVYFMTAREDLLLLCKEMAPDIARCSGAGSDPWDIVEKAIRCDCQKVQLFKPDFNQKMIDRAHAHNIRCNVFWSDDPEETKQFLDMGIDTILTNDYNRIAQAVNKHGKDDAL